MIKIKSVKLRRLLIIISILIGSGILALFGFILLIYFGAAGPLPKSNVLKQISNEEASLVFSSDGEIIGKFFAKNRTNIQWEEVPEHLRNALVATEDKRFFSHQGFDIRSYVRVVFRSILLGDKSGGGGSTLTQQLVKNLYGRSNHGFLSIPVNKVKEAILASRMEKIYTKEELLLLYLNSVPFGEDVYGVESAANRYFNKTVRELKQEESAVLIGLLKANTYFNPRLHPQNSIDRRNMVLSLMAKEKYLTKSEADSLKQLPLMLDYANLRIEAPAGYFVYQIKKRANNILENIKDEEGNSYDLEKDGLRIHTTLNMQMQQMANNSTKSHLKQMQKLLDRELKNSNLKKKWIADLKKDSLINDDDFKTKKTELFEWDSIKSVTCSSVDSLWHYYKMLNASVLITEPQTGAILTWVGGNHFRYLPFDLVLAHRQIASTFKPILYATALENGYNACSYLENEEKTYEEFDDWKPQNFDLSSTPDTLVAFWYALAHSMNLPSVDLYFKLGYEKLVASCNALGLPPIVANTPSLALGTLDVSLYEIVRAYGVFANKGTFTDLVMIDKITDSKGKIIYESELPETREALSAESCEKLTTILQTAINSGTGTKIRTQYGIRKDIAGKTGTASNYSNAWFMAYTSNLVIGTWVGANTPDVHFKSSLGTGSSLALPIAGNILSGIEKDSDLSTTYFTNFEFADSSNTLLACQAYKPRDLVELKGIIERILHPNKQEHSLEDVSKKEEEKPSKVKSFFKRIFKKK